MLYDSNKIIPHRLAPCKVCFLGFFFFFEVQAIKRLNDRNTNKCHSLFSRKGTKTRYTPTCQMDNLRCQEHKNCFCKHSSFNKLSDCNIHLQAFQNVMLTWQYKHYHILIHFLHFQLLRILLLHSKRELSLPSRVLLQQLIIQK